MGAWCSTGGVDKLDPGYKEEESDNSDVTKVDSIYRCEYLNISPEGSRDLSYPDIQLSLISKKLSPRQSTFIRLRDVDESSCKEILLPSFRTSELSLDTESSDSDSKFSFLIEKRKKLPWNTPPPIAGFFIPSGISSSSLTTRSPSYNPLPITEVIRGKLYLGCEEKAADEEELLALGITHILSVTNRINHVNGVEHKHFVMSDWGRTNLKTVLDEVYPFMEQAQQPKKKLFVYCKLGQNRSPTLIISFLMKNKGLTLYKAHKLVKDSRPVVQIHEKYAKMLLRLEEDLFGETSLPENWMEQEGRDLQSGVPIFQSMELTVEEQNSFKEYQRASIKLFKTKSYHR